MDRSVMSARKRGGTFAVPIRVRLAGLGIGLLASVVAHGALAFSSGPYFPLPDGATWTYQSSVSGTYSSTVTGSITFNGAPVRVVHDNDGGESYYSNDTQGIRLHGTFYPDPTNGDETDNYEPPVPLAATETTVGTPALGSGSVVVSVGGSIDSVQYTSSSTVVAFENVTVPAGTFDNTVHVHVRIDYIGANSFYQSIDAWLAQGIGAVKWVNYDSYSNVTDTQDLVAYTVPDIVPDAFSFAPQTVQAYTVATSDPITVSGIDAVSPIEVVGGQYSVNGGAATAAPGSVSNGDHVTVSVTAPAPGQSTTATVYIGGVAGSFTATSIVDTTPDLFSFAPATGAPTGVTITSDYVGVFGINAPTPISITGGEYSILEGPFTSAPGLLPFTGAGVRLRVASSTMPGTTTSAVVTVGGVSSSFSVTTASASAGPRTVLYYQSQTGDWIGQGFTRVFDVSQTPPEGLITTVVPTTYYGGSGVHFQISESFNGVSGIDSFDLSLGAPTGMALAPGRYQGVAHFADASVPGLSFQGNGRGCSAMTGRFDVLEAVYDSNGLPTRFAANFEQYCDGNTAGLFGQIRYNSDIPLGSNAIRRWHSDFNADGFSDILWRNQGLGGTGQNYLYPMSGTQILGTEGYLRTVADLNWKIAGVGDFDGDGHADILWRNSSTGQNYIYFMNGTTILPSAGYIRTVADQNWQVAGVGDFDGDGKADILWRNSSTGQNYIYFMNALAIQPSEGYIRQVPVDWQVAGIGDFDGDGKADILWRNSSTGQNYLYPMNGKQILGTEGYLRTVAANLGWTIAGVGDFNGDGKADILWRNSSTGQNYLYPMNGTQILGTEGYLRTVADQHWQVAAVGDCDGDGRADILWRNASSGQNYLYPMNGTQVLGTEGYVRTVADPHWSIIGR